VKTSLKLAACAALALAAVPSLAASDPAATNAARQDGMKQIGGAQRAIGGELRKDAPDLAVVKANAEKLQTLAGQIPGWFPTGTGAEAGVKTAAKAEIWSDSTTFAADAAALETQAGRLAQAAAGIDVAAVKAQAGPLGGACKACHDGFRAPPPTAAPPPPAG